MRQLFSPVSPYAELFRAAVQGAHAMGASDVHIEPTRTGVDIRFRVYGEMRLPWKRLSIEHKQSFLNAVKRETRLAIGVSGSPQDSRCTVQGLPIDLRVNLLPTLHGEKIVLRLLDANREFGIQNLALPETTKADLLDVLRYRNGVVLMSGPTGSGKTTTLYSLLCAIDRRAKNIVTLEDPVEYTIEGINQVQIDRKVPFGQALRAVLRQDPDVILVGEIRDEETASLAFKAAATGHLVLSTVHANGAAEVVSRLLNLGVDRDTLRSNLRFSAAQRLVPLLCPHCRIKAPALTVEALKTLLPCASDFSQGIFCIKSEDGCEHCSGGIKGRIPVLEYLRSAQIDACLSSQPGAAMELTVSLRDASFEIARSGKIDIREVMDIA
jgi:type II secretory ATPase GspE/PulE/Tfp pilus assembly ATPase PilB-like protein